jgi:hypothetical protein
VQPPGFDPSSGHVGFMADKVVLRQVFYENFSFLCQFLFYQMLYINYFSHHVTVHILDPDSVVKQRNKKQSFLSFNTIPACSDMAFTSWTF